MRALLVLIGLAALVVVGLMSFGLLTFNGTAGSLPTVKLEGGSAPKVKADMATISVGTENKTIEVPTVGTTQKTITVPTVKMNTPSSNSAAPAQ
ncbi:hypothetical protein G4G27_17935 [Sphingomonas sp. So64.6b]|uniref:hypothetical protein n=1 Tax=Sphingomonas sp. So64.6b TaxID=2997354 RepID=UPI0016018D7A|nr:hypothetical protein [Sphingomonas sp. So64.6b]QNA85653.1 hypothetical protein G4G27_17935 [Sphingomonas sp. So64.6b]